MHTLMTSLQYCGGCSVLKTVEDVQYYGGYHQCITLEGGQYSGDKQQPLWALTSQYFWFPSTILMVSLHNTEWCTPKYRWNPFLALNILHRTDGTVLNILQTIGLYPSAVLNTLQCNDDIPTVLINPHSTAQKVPQGDTIAYKILAPYC